MLETSYTLNLGNLLKIVPRLKRYLWHKLKLDKTQNPSKTTTDKQISFSISEVGTFAITIDNHMAVIQV
jgi:hypothetical protein